jgi:hypothetical protein
MGTVVQDRLPPAAVLADPDRADELAAETLLES